MNTWHEVWAPNLEHQEVIENLGRYQPLGILGKGAMAEVYKAYDPKINRTLAIKILKVDHRFNDDHLKRFLREAKTAGALSHPNIVTIYDVGEYKGIPYIVMEFLEETTLEDLIHQGHAFSTDDVLHYGQQLAAALDYAHGKGVIHRDIKPGNIIIDLQSRSSKITDFGIARSDTLDETEQTRLGDVLGTPQYMSPEQVMGDKVDGRSDLFSLGVILYQLLSGIRPFQGDTLASLLFQITSKDPMPLEHYDKAIPLELVSICNRLLEKHAHRRFQTGAELTQALAKAQAQSDSPLVERLIRLFPPRVFKFAIASLLVFSMTFGGAYSLFKHQYDIAAAQSLVYGNSLVKLLSNSSAEAVLSEDWPLTELLVKDMGNHPSFVQLVITDHKGIVRGAKKDFQPGSHYSHSPDTSTLQFQSAIEYQNQLVGSVYLELQSGSLTQLGKMMLISQSALATSLGLLIMAVIYILSVYKNRGSGNSRHNRAFATSSNNPTSDKSIQTEQQEPTLTAMNTSKDASTLTTTLNKTVSIELEKD